MSGRPAGRWQPPVYSPLSARALLAGAAAVVSGREDRRATERVERWAAETFGSEAVLLTDSGTTALALALGICSEGRTPRRVALPAWGCYDLATACDAAAVEVALYDLDPATLGPDWDDLERVLAQGAAGLVVAHYYGMPVDLDRARAAAARHGALLIEDAAQGTGGAWRGRPLGAHGELAVLSFGRGKGLTGSGGGALLGNTSALAQSVRRAGAGLAQGSGAGAVVKGLAQWLVARPGWYALPAALPFLRLGETIYRPAHPAAGGARGSMSVLAAVLELAPPEAEVRRRHATRLAAAAAGAPGLATFSIPEGADPGWLRLPLLTEAREHRLDRGARRLGIQPGYPEPLLALPGFRDRLVAGGELPGARRLAAEVITLPVHGLLAEPDLRALEAWIRARADQGNWGP